MLIQSTLYTTPQRARILRFFGTGALCFNRAANLFWLLLPPSAEKHPQVLRQNRRVTKAGEGREKELENFHGVLMDISEGKASPRVRTFIASLLVWRSRVIVRLCAFGGGSPLSALR